MSSNGPAPDNSPRVAIIGGSGLYTLQSDGAPPTIVEVPTPYSDTAVRVQLEQPPSGPVWFCARHGADHSIAPHLINYRANLWALQQLGVRDILAVNAVGGITAAMTPGTLASPDQIIDYSWGREHTFVSDQHALDKHIDFTWPYNSELREVLQLSAHMLDLPLQHGGVYACTQGPRLETAAEIRRLARDGCDIVGMTGMPEAALARELGLRYACIALVVNKAAGLGEGEIKLSDVEVILAAGIRTVRMLLVAAIAQLQQVRPA